MKAYSLLREQPYYRRDVFESGLRAAGHKVHRGQPPAPDANTLLLIWNRYAEHHTLAKRVESAGGMVIVAENGYIGKNGVSPKFDVYPDGPKADSYYAISFGYHNSDDVIVLPENQPSRFAQLNIEVKPWRFSQDGYILLCPNRSFGVPERMMHPDWATRAAMQLRAGTSVPIRIRMHPGNNAPKRSLQEDLEGANVVVIWSSSVGVHALVQGVPVVCCAPYWICKSAALTFEEVIAGRHERLCDPTITRSIALERMAWGQWTCEEIASGLPFKVMFEGLA
jgi:hypothetical protein